MLRKETTIEIDGVEFVIKELSRGQMGQFIDRFGGEETMQAQNDMIGECVYLDGEPLADKFTELGMSASMQLQDAVMDVHGLAQQAEEGNA